uniref:GLIPR1-like protein 1 isoform X1 n=1 Tax=Styela clava TaxID=7725 RepID=UPI00193A16E0|nr:GLIPR1-like protein 1 isoform X1 [Styela clava]XP_039274784.1 GLIPR1-like protein 1 isoform X1 [Styela clava]
MDVAILMSSLFLAIFVPLNVEASDFLYHSPMEATHKQQWVDSHNYYRRNVSNPAAANMRLMTWDDELAAFAEDVVKTCNVQHTVSSDLRTSVFSYIGENLYAGEAYYFNEMMGKNGIVKLWYDEIKYYNYVTASCQSGQQCGHYTQIVWAETYKVGCAIGKCKNIGGGYGSSLVSCNYGPGGNKVLAGGSAFKPYIKGTPCSQCETGDLCIDQLCNNTARDVPFTIAPTSAENIVTTGKLGDTTHDGITAIYSTTQLIETVPTSNTTMVTSTEGNNGTATSSSDRVQASQTRILMIYLFLAACFSKMFYP